MERPTRRDAVVEDQRQTCMVDSDGDEAHTLRPLQAAAVAYRIALGSCAGHRPKKQGLDGTGLAYSSPP